MPHERAPMLHDLRYKRAMRLLVGQFSVLAIAAVSACATDEGPPISSSETTTSAGLTTSSTSSPGDETGARVDESTGAASTETSATDSGGESTAGISTCADEFPAVVTDIDGTLTVADAEFLMQVDDGNYDPQERFGAHQLLGAYAERGYRILYLTGRPEIWTVAVTNETAREATERWLEEHGFPNDPDLTQLVLAPRLLSGEAAQAFKAQAVIDLQREGWRFDYAYGNSVAEIGGYEDAGIAKEATFIIGTDSGMGGTAEVEGQDWSTHANAQIPTVPFVCGAQ